MLTEDAKNQILKSLIEVTSDIADKKYQERVWIRGEGPECDSFDDCVNYYLDEADSVLNNNKSFNLSRNQYQILKAFQDAFKKFAYDNIYDDEPEEFIESPEWAKIMKMAKEVLVAFNYKP